MKILFLADFIPPRHIGGPGKRVFETALKMHELGHSVSFITSCQRKEDERETEKDGVKIYSIYSNYPSFLRDYFSIYNPFVLKKIKKIISRIKPDIVHADIVHTHLSYASLKIAKNISPVLFIHARDFMFFNYGKFLQKERVCGHIDYRVSWFDNLKKAGKRFNPLRNFLIKKYLKYADKIIVISDELAEALKQNGFTNLHILRHGYPIHDKEPEFCGFESKKILLFGRISEAKGVCALLSAFPFIKLKVPDAKIILVGVSDCEKGKIVNYILKNNINQKDIEIYSWMKGEEIVSILKSVALVVSPSTYPDPLLAGSNYEAASFKKPIVTTCFGGAKEFVLDGRMGYVVNPFDKEGLANKIVSILTDKEKAESFGESAYKRLKSDFSLEKCTKKLLEIYDSFLN